MANNNNYSYIQSTLNDNLHNKLGSLNDPRRLIERAVRLVINEVNVTGLLRTVPTSPMFNEDGSYSLPDDLREHQVVAIRRHGQTTPVTRISPAKFRNGLKGADVVAIANVEGRRILLAHGNGGNRISLEEFDADSGWTPTGDAGTLDFNTQVYTSGNASLRFATSGVGTAAGVSNVTLEASDMTTYKDNSSHFVNVFLPNKAHFTSIIIRWGTDLANYWERTLLLPDGDVLVDGFNRFKADWRGATVVGTPDVTSSAPLAIVINYDGTAEDGYLIDDWTLVSGSPFEVDYLTDDAWQDVNGNWKHASTVGTDVLMLDEDAVELVIVRASMLGAQVLREAADLAEFKGLYYGDGRGNAGLKRQYVATHPPVTMPQVDSWMDVGDFDKRSSGMGQDEVIIHSR